MTVIRKFVALAAFVACLSGESFGGPFGSLYVFGDSLSDGGNAYNIVRSVIPTAQFPPPPNNRRNSDGFVAAEYLGQALGITLAPSTEGGTNYAVSGAMTGVLTSVFPLPPALGGTLFTTENYADPVYGVSMLRSGTGLGSQVNQFLSSSPAFDPDSTLFLVWAGANDLFFSPQASTVQSALANIAAALLALVGAGAEDILVPGLPNLALTPAIRELDAANPGLNIADGYRDLSLGFNQGLDALLTLLSSQLHPLYPDLRFFPFDVNDALLEVIANPGALGLTNVTQGCNDIAFTTTCANPQTYLFWDPVHPTDRVHAELGRQFAAAVAAQVPEPGTVMLLVVAAVGLGFARLTRPRSRGADSQRPDERPA